MLEPWVTASQNMDAFEDRDFKEINEVIRVGP